MASWNWVNIGSGNALLPDSTKPLLEVSSNDNQLQEIPQPSIDKFSLKITCLIFHWNLPGANELMSNLFAMFSVVFVLSIYSHNFLVVKQHISNPLICRSVFVEVLFLPKSPCMYVESRGDQAKMLFGGVF